MCTARYDFLLSGFYFAYKLIQTARHERCIPPRYRLLSLQLTKIFNILAGAAVLAHSLRDSGTTKKLAAMITMDTLSADSVTELNVRSPTIDLGILANVYAGAL